MPSKVLGMKDGKMQYLTEEERTKMERTDYMQTTNGVNQKVAFNTGLLVNRIFVNKINGSKESANQLRESIDQACAVDRYSGVPTGAIEEKLKALARRQNNKSCTDRPYFKLNRSKILKDSKKAEDADYSRQDQDDSPKHLNNRTTNYHTRDLNQFPFFNYV